MAFVSMFFVLIIVIIAFIGFCTFAGTILLVISAVKHSSYKKKTSQGIPVNLRHLNARLVQSGYIGSNLRCTEKDIKDILYDRFAYIDYEQAKEDVLPFIKDSSSLKLWNREFFRQITDGLKISVKAD